MNWDSMAAAGGIISSADDMSSWLRAQLRGGELTEGKRLFSDRSAHEMFQAQIAMKLPAKPSARFSSTHFRAYGLGWALSDYKGNKVVGHGGGYDGMYSQVLLVPEQKLGVVVLTNSMTSISSLLGYRALDLFLGGEDKNWSAESLVQFRKSREEFDNNIAKAITPAAKDTKPSHPLKDYAGQFQCPMYGNGEVSVENDKLVLKLLRIQTWWLTWSICTTTHSLYAGERSLPGLGQVQRISSPTPKVNSTRSRSTFPMKICGSTRSS